MKKNVLKRMLFIALALGFCSVAQAQPTQASPAPPSVDPEKRISIYGVYGGISGINYGPMWGQSTVMTQANINNEDLLVYSNLNYQGIEFAAQNFGDMTTIYIDIWCDESCTLRLTPISNNPSKEQTGAIAPLALTGGQWNPIQIPLSDYDQMIDALYNIWQFKIDGGNGETIYISNFFIYNSDSTADTQAPVLTDARAGTVSPNSIQLILEGTDNSGAVFYEISHNGNVETANGQSGVQATYEVTGLQGGTMYTFTVTPKDRAGNTGASQDVTASTEGALPEPQEAAPVPTHADTDVFSIYSDSYDAQVSVVIGGWGQSTQVSEPSIDGNSMYKLENFNYLGLELNNNVGIDLNEMTTLHIDVWTPNETLFRITPIWTGGAEDQISCTPLSQNVWNSFDIPLSDFQNINTSDIYQIKLVGSTTANSQMVVYIDNLYFYKETTTGINKELSDNISITGGKGILTIRQAAGESILVSDLVGKVIYQDVAADNAISVSLSEGIYIVKAGNNTNKVVVK